MEKSVVIARIKALGRYVSYCIVDDMIQVIVHDDAPGFSQPVLDAIDEFEEEMEGVACGYEYDVDACFYFEDFMVRIAMESSDD